METWDIPSGSSSRTYTVTLRPDSKFGGQYFHCNCQGWLGAMRNGNDCKHVTQAKAQMGMAPALPRPVAPRPAPAAISQPVPERGVRPKLDQYGMPKDSDASKARALADELATHFQGTCGIKVSHSKQDHDAVILLGVVTA